MMWSWILAVIGVAGIYFVGRKDKWGWFVLLFNECLWMTYAIVTNQYGFIFSAIAIGFLKMALLSCCRMNLFDETLSETR